MKTITHLLTLSATLLLGAASASGALSAPSVVEASDGAYDDAVMVTWTSVPGAESYRLFRSNRPDWRSAVEIGVTCDTSFIDPVGSRRDVQPVFYWVMAESDRIVSVLSEVAIGTPKARPFAPRGNSRIRDNFQRLRQSLSR